MYNFCSKPIKPINALVFRLYSRDVGEVVSTLFPEVQPPTILMGHSMGGAIAVHATFHNFIDSIMALIVIDVVEGTAVDALASMQSFLRSRPSSFSSVKDAISWRFVRIGNKDFKMSVIFNCFRLSQFIQWPSEKRGISPSFGSRSN